MLTADKHAVLQHFSIGILCEIDRSQPDCAFPAARHHDLDRAAARAVAVTVSRRASPAPLPFVVAVPQLLHHPCLSAHLRSFVEPLAII
ncbi:MAG: hypothetical protein U0V48_00710 [Anaerolineales bacterium]